MSLGLVGTRETPLTGLITYRVAGWTSSGVRLLGWPLSLWPRGLCVQRHSDLRALASLGPGQVHSQTLPLLSSGILHQA